MSNRLALPGAPTVSASKAKWHESIKWRSWIGVEIKRPELLGARNRSHGQIQSHSQVVSLGQNGVARQSAGLLHTQQNALPNSRLELACQRLIEDHAGRGWR